ncbi:hypothetical protein [Lederbergia citri]|uniref:Uncharacterized protein n=1 Tax=Lederbergia citri TaxID=2833580 RepID=A0A942TIQ5_9BACI|nr:hypothetical protein [Lederbergia citri]MBS4196799.1 hypothetical protein [Lederbergia citri]
MIKKLIMTVIIFALFGAFLYGYMVLQYKEKKINEAVYMEYSEITKIIFYDGRGNNPPITLEDKEKIQEFNNLLDGYIIKKEKFHEKSKGWIHRADFYKDDKQFMSITFSNPMQINGKYYEIVEGDINPETIDNFLKSIDSD